MKIVFGTLAAIVAVGGALWFAGSNVASDLDLDLEDWGFVWN